MAHNHKLIEYHAGNARPLDFEIYTEKALDPGQPDLTSPVDLSAASAIEFAVADSVTGVAHFTKTLISGIAVTGANSNIIRVTLAEADTEDLTPGHLYYEIKVTQSGDVWTGPHGEFKLEASVYT